MSSNVKADATEIQAYIDELQKQFWLSGSRAWWPRFIFHFTNINNAVRILERGKLQSRSQLEQSGEMMTDNASPEVIEQTESHWKDYVRLYFRPRTPTQNKNEGFRPAGQRELNSHCPVPIYFLFDSKKLLSRENVSFSKGSLASSGTPIYADAQSFKEIPFQKVYHDTWFYPEERSSIIFHRHAEVVVPTELPLDDLKHVWCRSEAEYKTLINLLTPETRERWKNKIGGGKKGNLFFRNGLFIEEVDLSTESIAFKINKPGSTFDPIHVRVEVTEVFTGREYSWEDQNYEFTEGLEIGLSVLEHPESYKVMLFFEDQLMYCDEFNSIDLDMPF